MPGGRIRARLTTGLLACLGLALGACSSPTEPTPKPDAPSLTCPSDLAVVSKDASPVVASYTLPTAIGGAPPVSVACTPASGSSFPPGTTTVSCTATDTLARTATCGFSVKVSVPPRLQLSLARVPATITFMAFGDSMTAGKPGTVMALGVEDFPGSYPSDLYTALVARYTAQSFTMSKQGWAGEPTSVAVTRLQTTLPAVKPDVVLLMDGANDLFGGNPAAIAPALSNMRQMVLMSKSAGALVFLAKLPPQVPGGTPPRGGGYALVETYDAGIATIGNETNTPVVDLYTVLKADVGAYIGPDGLHPTTAGYQKIADTFFASIQATMEIPGTAAAGVPGTKLGTQIQEEDALRPLLSPGATSARRRTRPPSPPGPRRQ